MKHYLLGFVALMGFAKTSHALPVLNLSAAGNEMVTIYPDNTNPNLFYVSPTALVVGRDEHAIPLFSYTEYKDCMFCDTKAIVQVVMKPLNANAEYASAIETLKKRNEAATFAGVAFLSSRVVFGGALAPLIESSECQHTGGVVGAEEQCTFRLSQKGAVVMRDSFRRNLTITMGFEYVVSGVTQKADGTFEEHQSTFQIAGRIGSRLLAQFPELFLNSKGKPIKNLTK